MNEQTSSSRLESVQVWVVVPAKLDLIWAIKCNCAVSYLLKLHIFQLGASVCAHKCDDEFVFRAVSVRIKLYVEKCWKMVKLIKRDEVFNAQ